MKTYHYNHTSEETAKTVEDYPWGYSQRTTIRYWIETSPRHGQRFCSQTINPKTGRWCKPKKGTYEEVLVLIEFDAENNQGEPIRKTSCIGVGKYSKQESVINFYETHKDNLTDWQLDRLKQVMAFHKVMEKVTFEIVPNPIGPVSLMSNDPKEIEKREQMQTHCEEHRKQEDLELAKISQAIRREYQSIELR